MHVFDLVLGHENPAVDKDAQGPKRHGRANRNNPPGEGTRVNDLYLLSEATM